MILQRGSPPPYPSPNRGGGDEEAGPCVEPFPPRGRGLGGWAMSFNFLAQGLGITMRNDSEPP